MIGKDATEILKLGKRICRSIKHCDGICGQCDGKNWDCVLIASELCHANCEIIKDDEMIVKKSNYEALLFEQKRLREIVDRIPCGYVQKEEVEYWKSRCEEIGDIASKETTREIFQELKNRFVASYLLPTGLDLPAKKVSYAKITEDELDELANRFGIE